ncbi:hypothetical protein F5Y01DRAFT_55686 [Xylaria sp. FL0043]|nr:hypothetical protein F5Y01DRAFT_55686 [Xylaria sp. FL0043]
MAFTAIYLPRDNDPSQLSMWPDNGDQTITGDNFSDFVSFDPEDAATFGGEDLPSPSKLLEDLQNDFSNATSYQFGLPPNGFHPETPATATSEPITVAPVAASADQPDADSAPTLARDPILGTGSISDSELLRLEGISIKSSPHRGTVTAPSSPMSPRKKPGFFSTLRRRAHRPKPAPQEHFQSVDTANTDNFLGEPNFFDLNYNEFADQTIPIKQEPIECNGLPSPPLTGRIPNIRQRNPSGFVSGHLDDPFCDTPLDMPVTIKQEGINAPLGTHIGDGETFSRNPPMTPLNTNVDTFRRPQKGYRSTSSSAKWPTEGYLTDARYSEDPNMWSSTPPSAMYVADSGNGNISNPGWWDGSPTTAELLHTSPTHNGGQALSMHNQPHTEMQFEYNSNNNAELSGLMIHMPQPRGPQASVLSSNLHEHVLAIPPHHNIQSTPRARHMSGYHGNGNGNGGGKGYGGHTDSKRPRPRAPSSGARHHHHHPHGAQTSPRKLRNSHSMGYLREESQSPSPMPMARQHRHHPPPPHPHPHAHSHSQHGGPPPPLSHPSSINGHHQSHQERRQHRSASLTMRKQRSFTRRASSSSYAASPTCGPHTGTSSHAGPGLGHSGHNGSRSGSGIGGGVCVDFVNFTPSDSTLLMTGVAPSGSSKTKARREKEAQEREKEAQEKLLKVVKAVGGDVRKLIGEFI